MRELKSAICESFIHDRKAYLMEQFIEGSHFRLMTLRGKYIACSRRVPARVIGNGKQPLKTLIAEENRRRYQDGHGGALYPIVIDNEARRKLRSMGTTLNTVPHMGEEVYIRDSINMCAGGDVEDVDDVCEDVKRTCEHIAKLLGIYLGGFDIIARDITRPLAETGGVINEVNTAPGLEATFRTMRNGQPLDVAEIVLRDMFDL